VTATVPALSVLDLIPVRTDQTSADAVRATLALARTADELGYRRYWVAEHHNMPAVAATNPPVVVALIGSATERIRIGSGGVMLPNHAPLVVAEQFALLEAAFPGRVDLGIGRAPGSDPVTSWALRAPAGRGDEDVARFPDYVNDVIMLMNADGVQLDLHGRAYDLHATPRAVSAPPVWLLGSSDYSARLAAQLGLPYVFAHHFSGRGTAEALALYRSSFQPAAPGATPQTFLTVNAVVAEDAGTAQRLALPQQRSMAALRSGQPLHPQWLVEEAEATPLAANQQALVDDMTQRWVIGPPDEAARRIAELADTYGVDEVMVNPVAGAFAGTSADAAPARVETLRLLAAAFGPHRVRSSRPAAEATTARQISSRTR
jgi:luciferase family oxidoreductase group 1